mmetsp:Transcript_57328/g.92890  ORF Transcript_57328/g.92890 Transcript_57328/m.92890 type:complete len:240 (+) Transcript_57328:1830-2549(+)
MRPLCVKLRIDVQRLCWAKPRVYLLAFVVSLVAPRQNFYDIDLESATPLVRVEAEAGRPILPQALVDPLLLPRELVRLLLRLPPCRALRVGKGPDIVCRLLERGSPQIPHQPESWPETRLLWFAGELCRDLHHTPSEAEFVPALQHRRGVRPLQLSRFATGGVHYVQRAQRVADPQQELAIVSRGSLCRVIVSIELVIRGGEAGDGCPHWVLAVSEGTAWDVELVGKNQLKGLASAVRL